MSWLLLVLKFLPSVLQAVVAVESVASGLPGATKKKIILDSVKAVAVIGKTVDDAHVQVVSNLVDTTVKSLNDSGLFTKTVPKP